MSLLFRREERGNGDVSKDIRLDLSRGYDNFGELKGKEEEPIIASPNQSTDEPEKKLGLLAKLKENFKEKEKTKERYQLQF